MEVVGNGKENPYAETLTTDELIEILKQHPGMPLQVSSEGMFGSLTPKDVYVQYMKPAGWNFDEVLIIGE